MLFRWFTNLFKKKLPKHLPVQQKPLRKRQVYNIPHECLSKLYRLYDEAALSAKESTNQHLAPFKLWEYLNFISPASTLIWRRRRLVINKFNYLSPLLVEEWEGKDARPLPAGEDTEVITFLVAEKVVGLLKYIEKDAPRRNKPSPTPSRGK